MPLNVKHETSVHNVSLTSHPPAPLLLSLSVPELNTEEQPNKVVNVVWKVKNVFISNLLRFILGGRESTEVFSTINTTYNEL